MFKLRPNNSIYRFRKGLLLLLYIILGLLLAIALGFFYSSPSLNNLSLSVIILVIFILVCLMSLNIYIHQYELKQKARERELIIERTFTQIHSLPLQTLSRLKRDVREKSITADKLETELEKLDNEIRETYDFMRRSFLVTSDQESKYSKLLMSEALSEVIWMTMGRDFPGFRTLKIKVLNFVDVDNCPLTQKQKLALCLFLEEALCNIGKHAVNATRLEILYTKKGETNVFQIVDNGESENVADKTLDHKMQTRKSSKNRGTQQAISVARLLHGTYNLRSNTPHGRICELIWIDRKGWLGRLRSFNLFLSFGRN